MPKGGKRRVPLFSSLYSVKGKKSNAGGQEAPNFPGGLGGALGGAGLWKKGEGAGFHNQVVITFCDSFSIHCFPLFPRTAESGGMQRNMPGFSILQATFIFLFERYNLLTDCIEVSIIAEDGAEAGRIL